MSAIDPMATIQDQLFGKQLPPRAETIDHKAEAVRLIQEASAVRPEVRADTIALAQVHATLHLAEQIAGGAL